MMSDNQNKKPENFTSGNFDENAKDKQLENFREDSKDQYMTTDQGVRVSDVDNSLTAGSRGPTLMEDFIFRERITHLDHESIPERVVHARGSGAHGYFQPYSGAYPRRTSSASAHWKDGIEPKP